MGRCDGIGRPNSEAIPISINARSAYSPAPFSTSEAARGEARNLITNLLLLPGLRCARRPRCGVSSTMIYYCGSEFYGAAHSSSTL